MTVRWRTDVAVATRVEVGINPAELATSYHDPAPKTEHIATIAGLSPGTRYFYAVGHDAGRLAGGDADHFFKTSPPPGSTPPVRLWVIGDSGTGGDGTGRAEAVRDAYLASPFATHADLWLMLGDNAYNVGSDQEFQRAMFETYPTLLRNTVLWPTFGNHEYYTDQGAPYFQIFSLPRDGEAGGVASGTEHYYSFDYANVHFICLDSMDSNRVRPVNGTMPAAPMLSWLEQDLVGTDKTWIIAFWHHPPYSKGSHDSDMEWEIELKEMRENVLPILEAGGVDLVLSGHSHCYERSCLLDGHYGHSSTLTPAMKKDSGDGREAGDGAYGKDPAPHAGAVYVVAGSSGKVSGGTFDHPVMITSMPVLGSMVIDIHGDRLDARFLDTASQVQDHFTISKAPLVTISGTQPILREEGGQAGSVVVSRTRNLSQPLPIQLALSGTATPGTDYSAAIASFSLGPWQSSRTLSLSPLTDALAEGTETIQLRLEPGAGYRLHRDARSTGLLIEDRPIDAWRFSAFGEDANSPQIAGNGADPDGDGQSNLAEFTTGTNPRDGSSRFTVEASRGAPGGVRIRFTAQPGRSYAVQFKDTMEGTWQALTSVAAGEIQREIEVVDSGAGQSRFYRVVTPLQP
jgi:hypothetical protein